MGNVLKNWMEETYPMKDLALLATYRIAHDDEERQLKGLCQGVNQVQALCWILVG